jgi:hypothetical protein
MKDVMFVPDRGWVLTAAVTVVAGLLGAPVAFLGWATVLTAGLVAAAGRPSTRPAPAVRRQPPRR